MKMNTHRIPAIAAVAAAAMSLALILPVSGLAETNDHLKCRRIEGADKLNTKVKIDALEDRFDMRRCKVKRARALCSPGARTGIDPKPEFAFVEGDEIAGDYVCYKTKCRKRPDADIATDAFGARRIGKLDSKLLCVPTESDPEA